jgi:hypothetical protein
MPGDFPALGPRHCCTTLTRKPRRRLTRSADGEHREQGTAEQERPEADLAAQRDPPRGQ